MNRSLDTTSPPNGTAAPTVTGDDREALRRYVENADQRAFARLVDQYVDLVYSAALRQVKDRMIAEDVTQQVFALLSRKASSLGDQVLLGGWLVNTTRYVSLGTLRSESRRRKHERKAAAMAASEPTTDPGTSCRHNQHDWSDASDVLDDALAEIDEPNRGLLVMRYFEGRTGPELAARLGISEEAARKRLQRAIEQLRGIFARKGVVMSADALVTVLATKAVVAAPAGLAATVATAAVFGQSATAAVATKVSTFAAVLKTKAVVATAATVAVVSTGVVVVESLLPAKTAAPTQIAAADSPKAPEVIPARASTSVAGVVTAPDGAPVEGAEILLVPVGRTVNVYNAMNSNVVRTTTGAGGRFSLRRPDGDYKVVVRSKPGYAEISSRAIASQPNGDVRVEAWGTVSGVATFGGKPAANARVTLTRVGGEARVPPWSSMVVHSTAVQTDSQGRFTLNRAAPGEMLVNLDLQRSNLQGVATAFVLVEPGQAATIQLGGVGRTIAGKVVAPPDVDPGWEPAARATGRTYNCSLRRDVSAFGENEPGALENETPESYSKRHREWARTPEGAEYMRWTYPLYGQIAADGTFRFDGLPEGTYQIDVASYTIEPGATFTDVDLQVSKTIVVPPATADAGGGGDRPVDAGTLVATGKARLRTGEPMPDVAGTALDGSAWKSADHKGRTVVYVLWAPWADPAVSTSLTEVANMFANDARVTFVGLCYGNRTDVQNAVEQRPFPFPLLLLNDLQMPQLSEPPPTAVIVKPDGTILQRHVDPKNLRAALRPLLP